MGLAGVKNKRRIGDDPNNTKWARNTDGFGHKLLRAQGWEPGQFLGQKDAAHAEFHTAASASYIRTVLREDNLGLGAAPSGSGTADECTGLDVFKDLLGRLNGVSEEVIEQKQKQRADVKMTLYVERKYGPMRFVRGGLLVGDDIKEDDKAKADKEKTTESSATASASTSDDEKAARKREKKAKKERKERKEREKKEKKEKKEERSRKRKASDNDDDDNDENTEGDDRREKKSKRRRKHESEAVSEAEDDKAEDEERSAGKKEKKDKSHKKDKKSKKDKKEKKARKEEKRRRKEAARASESSTANSTDDEQDTATPSQAATPTSSAPAAPPRTGIFLSRRRYIAQKRAAVMDPQALKQIFMIKA